VDHIGVKGQSFPDIESTFDGELFGFRSQPGGTGHLTRSFSPGKSVSEQWVPRSEEDGGQGISLAPWVGSESP
jgi:hypothetical protein